MMTLMRANRKEWHNIGVTDEDVIRDYVVQGLTADRVKTVSDFFKISVVSVQEIVNTSDIDDSEWSTVRIRRHGRYDVQRDRLGGFDKKCHDYRSVDAADLTEDIIDDVRCGIIGDYREGEKVMILEVDDDGWTYLPYQGRGFWRYREAQ